MLQKAISMTAPTQTPAVPSVKSWKAGSRSAATALRTAADQLAIAERAVTASAESSGSTQADAGPRLLDTARQLQEVREIIEELRARIQAFQAGVKAASRTMQPPSRSGDPVGLSFANLMRTGALLDSASFQERAGFSRQALSKAVGARRLFYVEVGAIRGYPAFYLDPALQRKQVESICKLLGDLSGGSKWLFFTTPKGSLARQATGKARTPLEALADGDLAKVRTAAVGYTQR